MANKRYSRMKQACLCTRCGRKAVAGKTQCQACIDRDIETRQEREAARKEDGLCFCGGASISGKRLCQVCLDRNIQRYANRKKAGFCGGCGRQAVRGKSRCKHCTLKATARKHLGTGNRWRELLALYKRQKGVCPYTGVLLKLGEDASLDHIIASSKGGKSTLENLQWVHICANVFKGNTPAEAFAPAFNAFIHAAAEHIERQHG